MTDPPARRRYEVVVKIDTIALVAIAVLLALIWLWGIDVTA